MRPKEDSALDLEMTAMWKFPNPTPRTNKRHLNQPLQGSSKIIYQFSQNHRIPTQPMAQ